MGSEMCIRDRCCPSPTRKDRPRTADGQYKFRDSGRPGESNCVRITNLTDILVTDTADLLDVGGGLGHTLEGVTGEDELILDVGGGSNVDIGLSSDAADVLLTEEVADNKTLARVPSQLTFTV